MRNFLAVLPFLVMASSLNANNKDSLLAVFRNTALADSARVAALEQAIRAHPVTEADHIWALADTMERFGIAKGSKRYEGMGLRFKGIARLNQMRFADAAVYAQQALRVFTAAGDSVHMAKALNTLAIAYGYVGDRQNQVKHLLGALALAEAMGSDHDIAVTCFNLSAATKEPGAYDRAISYALRTVDLVENHGVQLNIAGVHQNLAGMYLDQGDLAGCREHMMRARAYKDPGVLVTNYSLEGELELKLGNVKAAEAAYRKAMELARPGTLDVSWAAIALGQFLAGQEQYNEAERLCKGALDQVTLKGRIGACECLEIVYKGKGDLKRLVEVQDLKKVCNDSISSTTVLQEVERYELRKAAAADSAAYAEKVRIEQEAARAVLEGERLRKRLFMGGGAGLLVVAFLLWRRLGRTRREKAQSEEILYNVLPEEVAREIRATGSAKSRQIEQVSVIFTDFQDFTHLSASLPHDALMEEVGACFTAFDGILVRYGIEKIKTIGDAYMAASGLKDGGPGAAARAVRAALDMQAFVEGRHAARTAQGLPAFRMRVGIHTGPVVAGIVGVKKFQYDIWGDTVNTANRMESSGEAGKVNVSEATFEAIKHDPAFTFDPRGLMSVKGKGDVAMWFVRREHV
jgi:adenylate cyclase